MKKYIIILILLTGTITANCDAIFLPVQYSGICYSAELIYSSEQVKKIRNTTNYWVGGGVVGSFFYPEIPAFGLEMAVEKRHYFQPEKFRNFFISAYLGTAFMTDFVNISDLGAIPGLKINYKAQISKNIVLEPYISLSLPICLELKGLFFYPPFPALTVGARFGFCKLKNEIINKNLDQSKAFIALIKLKT